MKVGGLGGEAAGSISSPLLLLTAAAVSGMTRGLSGYTKDQSKWLERSVPIDRTGADAQREGQTHTWRRNSVERLLACCMKGVWSASRESRSMLSTDTVAAGGEGGEGDGGGRGGEGKARREGAPPAAMSRLDRSAVSRGRNMGVRF